MRPTIELIFDSTCPNIDAARRQLRDALARAGRPPLWAEWDRAAPETPGYAKRYASPTVLVAGRDVAGGSELDAGDGCRVYPDAAGGFLRAPSVDAILAALTTGEATV